MTKEQIEYLEKELVNMNAELKLQSQRISRLNEQLNNQLVLIHELQTKVIQVDEDVNPHKRAARMGTGPR